MSGKKKVAFEEWGGDFEEYFGPKGLQEWLAISSLMSEGRPFSKQQREQLEYHIKKIIICTYFHTKVCESRKMLDSLRETLVDFLQKQLATTEEIVQVAIKRGDELLEKGLKKAGQDLIIHGTILTLQESAKGGGYWKMMTKEELELLLFLITQRKVKRKRGGEVQKEIPLQEIGFYYQLTDEAIRKKKIALESKYPEVIGLIRSFRLRNEKGHFRKEKGKKSEVVRDNNRPVALAPEGFESAVDAAAIKKWQMSLADEREQDE